MNLAPDGFIPGPRVRLEGSPGRPLSGLRFAAKDVFDLAGHVTGAGVPDRRRTNPAAERTADAVAALLDAGAELVGRTITDELAFSLEGRNPHDGAPPNPAGPGRITGGSSAGAASVVAAGHADFALGTDTGGSIRVPAALCGVHSLRPSHGAVAVGGTLPLAPGFDAVGWMSADIRLLDRVGDVLLPPDAPGGLPSRLAVAVDAFELADPDVARAARAAVAPLETTLGPAREVRIADGSRGELERWRDAFTTLQALEAWRSHGAWIERTRPSLSPAVAARFARGAGVSAAAAAEASALREAIAARLGDLVGDDGVLALPSAPTVAPRIESDEGFFASWRSRTLTLSCLAPLARVPQASVAAGTALDRDGSGPLPVGLGLIAGRGRDRSLLALVARAYGSPARA